MPVTTCWDCGDEYSVYSEHFVECMADGCGESYCGVYATCTYCNGQGYPYDDPNDYETAPGIYNYGYKPEPIWLGGRGAPYYLGFELEISADDCNTNPIYSWCRTNAPGMLYCKEDGSVEGFEIVSHPMTPEYFDSVDWPSFFDMLNDSYPLSRRREPAGHGLHVHVSRTAFPKQSTLARWSYLFNRNRERVELVARRSGSSWARFTDFPVSVCLPFEPVTRNGYWREIGETLPCGCCREREWVENMSNRIRRQFQSRAMTERYQAINLTNPNTVEVRVFRSTRQWNEFVDSLHFVMASVDFVRSMQPSHATRQATRWETFRDFVASHPVFGHSADAIAPVTV